MVPRRYRIHSTFQETHDTFTLTLSPVEGEVPAFGPGQFNMLYLFGFGEIPISISSGPSQREAVAHTIRAIGSVTQAMQRLKKGDEIGVRGPFGSTWPLPQKEGHVLLIAGGVGLAPLRSLVLDLAEHRDAYKSVTLLYGARTPEDLLYREEMEEWKKRGIETKVSVDRADFDWRGQVGVVTALIGKHLIDPQNTRVFLCGPEIMMRFAIHELMRYNVLEDEIYLAMERNMKCAVGFCGHCQYGPYFLCKDGPIFAFSQLKGWFSIKEL